MQPPEAECVGDCGVSSTGKAYRALQQNVREAESRIREHQYVQRPFAVGFCPVSACRRCLISRLHVFLYRGLRISLIPTYHSELCVLETRQS